MDLKNRVPGFFEKGRFKTSKKKKKKIQEVAFPGKKCIFSSFWSL